MSDITEKLLELAHELGREDRGLAILGEGNVSARISDTEFQVKASGSSLGTLREDQLATCSFDKLLPLLNIEGMSDTEIDEKLMESRTEDWMKKPSVEATFHATLLNIEGIHYVGHVHPEHVNMLLCSDMGEEFANKRLFPDQIVCCGSRSVIIPYQDPGLALAKVIDREVRAFIEKEYTYPKNILIENHGLIAIGKTAKEVLSGTLMAEKSARIHMGALAARPQGPVYLTPEQVQRIAGRPDEHYRQKMLNG
ncbi:MAG: class II aldolase/adducin family protein [Verrucomicrobiota bacterium]